MGVNTGTNRSRGGLQVTDNNGASTAFAYGVNEIVVTAGTLTNNGQERLLSPQVAGVAAVQEPLLRLPMQQIQEQEPLSLLQELSLTQVELTSLLRFQEPQLLSTAIVLLP